jgi:hypothetical protein
LNSFEVWLSGANRQVQSDFLRLLKGRDLTGSKLSEAAPGIDSIISKTIAEDPDFSDMESLRTRLQDEAMRFIAHMEGLLKDAVNL